MTVSTFITVRSVLGAFVLTAAVGCSRTPSEPEPSAASSASPSVTPLQWDPPGTWTALPGSQRGAKKAAYTVPHVGNDTEDAQVEVYFFGTGSLGDVDKNFKSWFDQFDGNVAATAKRDQFDAKGLHVEMIDTSGTYKVSLAPPIGPQKKSPVQMVKQSYRLVGAAVKTVDRGNWFFKLTGPDETVQAAKPAFRTMLESVR